MAYCGKCGSWLGENEKFCAACGARKGKDGSTDQSKSANFNQSFNEFNNTPDTTVYFDQGDIEANKMISIFAYLSWLVLVPIFGAKNSAFARFHANQGLVLAIIESVYWIVSMIIRAILLAIFWTPLGIGIIYTIVNIILSLVNIAFVVFAIIGIINASQGRAKELPIIGSIRILK